MKISQLRHMRVINLENGKVLGKITDLVLDVRTGAVKALVLPGELKWSAIWSSEKQIEVPWGKIKKLGKDVILVEHPQSWPAKD